jgi:Zn-dependent membrane protease YugP
LRLSPDVYRAPSVAAAGVAAHEMGHALQHSHGYAPLQLRSAIVPAVQFGSSLAPILFIIGFLLQLTALAWVGVILFALAVLFSLITLPVEFNASKRAKVLLNSTGILAPEEAKGVDKVLDAAALTYVAAAVAAVGQLLYYVLLLTGGGRRD